MDRDLRVSQRTAQENVTVRDEGKTVNKMYLQSDLFHANGEMLLYFGQYGKSKLFCLIDHSSSTSRVSLHLPGVDN